MAVMPGPAPTSTPAERERVLALVAAGRSYSSVAAEVFGDERFRGRVERILRRERDRPPTPPALEDIVAALASEERDAAAADSWLGQLVPLYGASMKARLVAGQPVSAGELLAFAQLEQRMKNLRELELLNAITRERG